jgi:hypothetical protein
MTALAHGGGVPETLSVLVPLAVVVVLLRYGARKMPAEPPPDPDGAEAGDQQSTSPVVDP